MKVLLRLGSIVCALLSAFGLAVIVSVLGDDDSTIIVWRFILIVIVTLALAYAAVQLWRRSNLGRSHAP